MRSLIPTLLVTVLLSCSGGKSTPAESTVSDSAAVCREILAQVGQMYRHVLQEDTARSTYLSTSYRQMCALGDSLADGMIWGADWDGWTMSQDPGPSPTLVQAEVLSLDAEDRATVQCTIDIGTPSRECHTTAILLLIREGDRWLVDDFVDVRHGRLSFRQAGERDIETMKGEQ